MSNLVEKYKEPSDITFTVCVDLGNYSESESESVANNPATDGSS